MYTIYKGGRGSRRVEGDSWGVSWVVGGGYRGGREEGRLALGCCTPDGFLIPSPRHSGEDPNQKVEEFANHAFQRTVLWYVSV